MAAHGGGIFLGTPFIRRCREPCSIADVKQTTEYPQHGRTTGAKDSLVFLRGDKWRRRRHEHTGALGCYFIQDAEKTECRAKMKGQTLQCLVNVCQFFSHVICGYDPLANTSTCSTSDIHSCLRHTLIFSFFAGGRG